MRKDVIEALKDNIAIFVLLLGIYTSGHVVFVDTIGLRLELQVIMVVLAVFTLVHYALKPDFLGQINNEMAGIRIRYGNILIGGTKLTDDIFLKNGDSRRFNKYYIGEIYLNNNDNLIPNSQRDNFEDTVTWRKIQNYIKEDFKLLEKDVRSFSTEYNKSIPKLRTKVEKIIDEIDDSLDSGMMTHDQKADLLEKTQKKIIELTKINKNKSDPNEQNDINKIKKKLEGRKIELQKKKKFKPPMLEAKLDRKQRFILEIITDYIRSEYGNEDVTKLRDVLLEKLTK